MTSCLQLGRARTEIVHPVRRGEHEPSQITKIREGGDRRGSPASSLPSTSRTRIGSICPASNPRPRHSTGCFDMGFHPDIRRSWAWFLRSVNAPLRGTSRRTSTSWPRASSGIPSRSRWGKRRRRSLLPSHLKEDQRLNTPLLMRLLDSPRLGRSSSSPVQARATRLGRPHEEAGHSSTHLQGDRPEQRQEALPASARGSTASSWHGYRRTGHRRFLHLAPSSTSTCPTRSRHIRTVSAAREERP
jgi:hypothetical protein